MLAATLRLATRRGFRLSLSPIVSRTLPTTVGANTQFLRFWVFDRHVRQVLWRFEPAAGGAETM